MNTVTLKLGFGISYPKLSVQINKLGLIFDSKKVEQFEKMREAITLLSFNEIIPQGQREKADQKLFNKIQKHLTQHNKEIKDAAI